MATQRMIFGPALEAMAANGWDIFGPMTFREYLANKRLPPADTATHISVDSLERLSPELRKSGTMVLRLGSAAAGGGTRFVLIGTPNRLSDFFLVDEEIFQATGASHFKSVLSTESFLAYSILPKLTEKSMINLAFASGLVGEALGLVDLQCGAMPVAGSGTYSFTFRPHHDLPDLLQHERGQVEIDAVISGRRNGTDASFVFESKMGPPSSLAKHKLVYPLLALAPKVPRHISLVPVYLRCQHPGQVIRYDLVECAYPDPREGLTSLVDLVPKRHCRYDLPMPGLGEGSGPLD